MNQECSAKRPYCFGLPSRSLKNRSDAPRDWCDTCDDFVACQEACETAPSILTLHLKERYFREIAAGTKLDEFREATHYWRKRLQGKTFDVIEVCNAYPERGDIENRLWFCFMEIRLALMEWDNAGEQVSGPTFAISLRGDRLDYPYQIVEQRRASSADLR